MSGNDTEKKLAAWQAGKEARRALDMLTPVFDSFSEGVVQRIKNLYAAGETDGIKYIAAAAQLLAVDEMKSTLAGKVTRGNNAAKEIVNE